MVQRLVEGGGEPNCWSGFRCAEQTKLGDVLLQLKNGGEIKVPVGLTFQPRRHYEPDPDDEEIAPKRTKLRDMADVSFKATWAANENSPLQIPRNRLPLTLPAQSFHPLDEPSPLGLTLKKTPSFLDLLSMSVGQGCGSNDALGADSSAQGIANRAGIPSTQGKLKASNFPASTLKIGSWERASRYEGDVVAKCYYAKRKLVWEVLETGLKSKIELQWSDISAIRASYGEGQSGVLEVEVSRPPLFFKETNPQPRKHTLWEATSDFTGGEATICKRHTLQFPEGVLNKHYEKLLQCDARLKALAGPSLHQNNSQENCNESSSNELKSEQLSDKKQSNVKVEMTVLPRIENRRSPSSVMESRGSEDSDTEECTNTKALVEATVKSEDVVDQKTRGVLVLTGSDNEVLNEIAQILLGENSGTKSSGDGNGLFRVSSMSGFFDDNWVSAPYSVSDWNSVPDTCHGNEGYGVDEKSSMVEDRKNKGMTRSNASIVFENNSSSNGMRRNKSIVFEIDEKGNANSKSIMFEIDEKSSGNGVFSKHGSSGDLLVNLPRIASLPQLFENGVRRGDSHLSLLELL